MVFSFPVMCVMQKIIYDGLVIGGGLSGSALAIVLAGEGKNILLLEKHIAPHHKVCGEFLSQKAVGYLQIFGIDPKMSGAHFIHSCRLVHGTKIINQKLPSPGWSLSRFILDEALLQKAEEAGASIRRGVTVRDFSWQRNAWEADLSQQQSVRGNNLFLATGKHDLRHWKRSPHTANKAKLIGFKMYFRLTPAQAREISGHSEIILIQGGYAGLQCVENQQANLCFLINPLRFHQCGKNWDALLGWLKEHSPHLSQRLEGAQQLWPGPVAISPMPYGYLDPEPFKPGLYRLGDQKAVIHPFAGDGMAIALHSAFSAADLYLKGGDSNAYHRVMHNTLRQPIRNAQFLAGLALNPYLKQAILPITSQFPGLLQQIYHATRC